MSAESTLGLESSLQFHFSQQPDFTLLNVQLQPGQKVMAEPSAMVSMGTGIELKAGFKGGITGTLGKMFAGESMIINTFTAKDRPDEVTFAPATMGDIVHYHLSGGAFFMQRGAYLANSEGIEITGSWQGAKGFFSGEGLVLLKAKGEGDIFFNSYGAILPIDVSGDYLVDTGYIVAFEESLNYHVTILSGLRMGGSLKSLFFGGEGLVCQFQGEGRVWVQTRYIHPFLSFINPFRPTKSN